jgi:hypothetical protein
MSDINWVTVQLPDWLIINMYDSLLEEEIRVYKSKLDSREYKPDREEEELFRNRVKDLKELRNSLEGLVIKIMRGEV